MMGNFGFNSLGWFGFGWVIMILGWLLIIVGLVVSVKWLINQGRNDNKEQSAQEILQKRYARGEIEKKEFEEKKKDLS